MSISSCIQSQDLNLIASFSIATKVVEIQHVCKLSSKKEEEGKECGIFIKGVIATH
jgi:hypothetical protein